MKLTYERAHELLKYNPKTGVLTWRVNRSAGTKIGDVAGTKDVWGYIRVRVDGKKYRAHRVVWLLVKGVWPENPLDHVDCDGTNNRIENLREVSARQSNLNRRVFKNNRAGLKGVSKRKDAFIARITIDGVRKYLGSFSTADSAHTAYAEAARRHFKTFARLA